MSLARFLAPQARSQFKIVKWDYYWVCWFLRHFFCGVFQISLFGWAALNPFSVET